MKYYTDGDMKCTCTPYSPRCETGTALFNRTTILAGKFYSEGFKKLSTSEQTKIINQYYAEVHKYLLHMRG